MNVVASTFSGRMSKVAEWIDLVDILFALGTDDIRRLRSRVSAANRTRDLHRAATGLGTTLTVVAYEGAFLTVCAEFELAIREMIEVFIDRACAAKPTFGALPSAMQKRQHAGCAKIITHIDRPNFNHLTVDQVVDCLYSCHPTSSLPRYRLLPEAFSENERNFSWSMLKEVMDRLGVANFLDRIGIHTGMAAHFGAQVGPRTANLVVSRLDEMMRRRNNIVHRGRTTHSPSATDVKECAAFLAALVISVSDVLSAHLVAL